MSEQMSLENYKQKVREFLRMTANCSVQETERLMKLYDDDFPEFLRDNWKPMSAGSAMMAGY